MKRRKAGNGDAEAVPSNGRTDLVCKLCGKMDDRLPQHFRDAHRKKLEKTFEDGLDSRIELEMAKAGGENDKSALSNRLRREATADFDAEMDQLRDEVTSFGWAKHYEYLRYQAVNVSEITEMLGAEHAGAAGLVVNFLAGRGSVIHNDAPGATASMRRGSASAASRQPQRTAEDEDESFSQEMFAGSALHNSPYSSIVTGPNTVAVAHSRDEAEDLSVEHTSSLPRAAESAVRRSQRSGIIADNEERAVTRKSARGSRSASTAASRHIGFQNIAATGDEVISAGYGIMEMFADPLLPDFLFSSFGAGPNTAAVAQNTDASEGLPVGHTNSFSPASGSAVRRSQRSRPMADNVERAVTRKSFRSLRPASNPATLHVDFLNTATTGDGDKAVSASFGFKEMSAGQSLRNDGTSGEIVDPGEQRNDNASDSPVDFSTSVITDDIVSNVAQCAGASSDHPPNAPTDANRSFAEESAVRRSQRSRFIADDLARAITRKTALGLRSASTQASRHVDFLSPAATGDQAMSVGFGVKELAAVASLTNDGASGEFVHPGATAFEQRDEDTTDSSADLSTSALSDDVVCSVGQCNGASTKHAPRTPFHADTCSAEDGHRSSSDSRESSWNGGSRESTESKSRAVELKENGVRSSKRSSNEAKRSNEAEFDVSSEEEDADRKRPAAKKQLSKQKHDEPPREHSGNPHMNHSTADIANIESVGPYATPIRTYPQASAALCENRKRCRVVQQRLTPSKHPLLVEFYDHLLLRRGGQKAETQARQAVACVARVMFGYFQSRLLSEESHALSPKDLAGSADAIRSFCAHQHEQLSQTPSAVRNFLTSMRRIVRFVNLKPRVADVSGEQDENLDDVMEALAALERKYRKLADRRHNELTAARLASSSHLDYAKIVGCLDSGQVQSQISVIAAAATDCPASITRKQYLTFCYYLMAALTYRNGQRPELTKTLTISEFLKAAQGCSLVGGLHSFEISNNKNSPSNAQAILPKRDVELMCVYYQYLRPLFANPDDLCAAQSFFVNTCGSSFLNVGSCLRRWLNRYCFCDATPRMVRHAAATITAKYAPRASSNSRAVSFLMGHSEQTKFRHYVDDCAIARRRALDGFMFLRQSAKYKALRGAPKVGRFYTAEFRNRFFLQYPVSLEGPVPSFSDSDLVPPGHPNQKAFLRGLRDLWRNEQKKMSRPLPEEQLSNVADDDDFPDVIPMSPQPQPSRPSRYFNLAKRVLLLSSDASSTNASNKSESEIDPAIILPTPVDFEKFMMMSDASPWQLFTWFEVTQPVEGYGSGVVVKCDIKKGQLIAIYKGHYVDKAAHEAWMESLDEETREFVASYRFYVKRLGKYILSHDDDYLGTRSFARYFNHSVAHPNAVPCYRLIIGKDGSETHAVLFYASRKIRKGQEVLWDYGPFYNDLPWYMECHCHKCHGLCGCSECKLGRTHPRNASDVAFSLSQSQRMMCLPSETDNVTHSSQVQAATHVGLAGFLYVRGHRNHLFFRKCKQSSGSPIADALHEHGMPLPTERMPECASFQATCCFLIANYVSSILFYQDASSKTVFGLAILCHGKPPSQILGLLFESSQNAGEWSIAVPPLTPGSSKLQHAVTLDHFAWILTTENYEKQKWAVLQEFSEGKWPPSVSATNASRSTRSNRS